MFCSKRRTLLLLVGVLAVLTLTTLLHRTPPTPPPPPTPPSPAEQPAQQQLLNILLFASPSAQPAAALDACLSQLNTHYSLALTILCTPSSHCPSPAQPHTTITTIASYSPSQAADNILILHSNSLTLCLSLDHQWLETATQLARTTKTNILTPHALIPTTTTTTTTTECRSQPGPAAIPIPPFLLPTTNWPASPHLHQIPHQQPLALALLLATKLNLPSRILPLTNQNSPHICHHSLKQLTPEQQIILRSHLLPSVAILLTQNDLDQHADQPSSDWLALACRIVNRFHAQIYLLPQWEPQSAKHDQQEPLPSPICPHAPIHRLSSGLPPQAAIQELLRSQPSLELLFYQTSPDQPRHLPSHLTNPSPPHFHCVLIGLPAPEIFAADWILGLELQALKKWHQPKIDISVITNDRSKSLSRLLGSLDRAAYYGDTVNLVINMEQTADQATRKMVEQFEWKHGSKTVRKRIIQAGLLPAVVEAWYPSSAHHSYGVLLEDDVEVSGYFYGWLKFALLGYRYSGRPAEAIYGISLYQPQHSELRPEGRRPFHAPALLAGLGLHPSTMPYASQVPCSWGALYFPETWTAFARFLTFRLANQLPGLALDQPVIPSPIRSNRWPKSWKKYLIEWVYLRGLVMIYPNYHALPTRSEPLPHATPEALAGLVPLGLSTNHLEIGTHVHNRVYRPKPPRLRLAKWDDVGAPEPADRARKAAQLKREFAIALKPLASPHSLLDGISSSASAPTLPSLAVLAVFDLWAEPVSLPLLRTRGFAGALAVGICIPFHAPAPSPLDDRMRLLADICA